MRETDQDAGQTARTLDRLTGAILDRRYRIDEKLAAGGFGSIYRAMDLVMGREVALKILHRELAHDAQVVERFKREASALAMLRDPHTITMYDVGESPDGTRYIVMELLRGESLHELFHASGMRLPWRRVITIARGVCSSLREAHAVGIVHRDLKPANIHLERNSLERDYVKVLDFGIAKLIDRAEANLDLTFAGQMIGTFDYMPPEQMIGGITTGKSDVFTLGVVLYEMIGGERPFGNAVGPASRLMTLLGTTPVPLGERATIPQSLERIIMRAIERDPELRPDIYQLDEELERIIDMESDDGAYFTSADDGPTWVEPQRPVRVTPLRVPNATRAPLNIPRRVSDTMLGSAATITPSRGVPIVPRAPATPSKPSVFAIGSRTAIPPVQATPAPPVVAPVVPQPVKVRFITPSTAPVPPTRLPTGTSSPMATEPTRAATDDAWKRQARDAFIRGAVYALLLVIVAATIYYLY
ncbi:MAG TPA: serine/threonine-protein kinase [Kofleriaceae bacterium]